MPRRGSLRTHPEKGATEGGAVDAAARVLGQPRGWRVAQGEGICKRAAWSAESEAREPEPRRAHQGVWRRGGGGGKDRTSQRALWARGGRRGGRRGRARLSSAPARPQTALRRPRLLLSARPGRSRCRHLCALGLVVSPLAGPGSESTGSLPAREETPCIPWGKKRWQGQEQKDLGGHRARFLIHEVSGLH
nr:uncharacterized protein LOC123567432 isoform X2 [Macaca fascicularis]